MMIKKLTYSCYLLFLLIISTISKITFYFLYAQEEWRLFFYLGGVFGFLILFITAFIKRHQLFKQLETPSAFLVRYRLEGVFTLLLTITSLINGLTS